MTYIFTKDLYTVTYFYILYVQQYLTVDKTNSRLFSNIFKPTRAKMFFIHTNLFP